METQGHRHIKIKKNYRALSHLAADRIKRTGLVRLEVHNTVILLAPHSMATVDTNGNPPMQLFVISFRHRTKPDPPEPIYPRV